MPTLPILVLEQHQVMLHITPPQQLTDKQSSLDGTLFSDLYSCGLASYIMSPLRSNNNFHTEWQIESARISVHGYPLSGECKHTSKGALTHIEETSNILMLFICRTYSADMCSTEWRHHEYKHLLSAPSTLLHPLLAFHLPIPPL